MEVLTTCLVCGKTIKVKSYRLAEKEGVCCSFECMGIRNRAEPNIECPVCGKKFHVKPSRMKRQKNICCSKECSSTLRTEIFCGRNNHQYGLKGECNSSFKSDIMLSGYGYILLRRLEHPFRTQTNYVFFHRLVMEEYLQYNHPDSDFLVSVEGFSERYLDPDIKVHHKNLNKLDNRISNLECTTLSEHQKYHNSIREHYRDEITGRFLKKSGKKKSNINPNLFKQHSQDAALDVLSSIDVMIPAKGSAIINTDLYVAIPENHVGLLWSRSGLSVKHKIEVGAGCIDASYRGEVKVHLYNFGETDYKVSSGNKIAQLLTVPLNMLAYEEVDSLENTTRGEFGFGSTGV